MGDPNVRVGVDVGGTFTDVVVLVDTSVFTTKVPTTAPQSDGVIEGIERVCEQAGISPESIDSLRHAMTVATNALLEKTGAETALVTTEGFGDVLAIGRQNRPSLYDLTATRPAPLVPKARRYEIPERVTTAGVERKVDSDELHELLSELDSDPEAIAISFLHAYAHEENERRVAAFLRKQTNATVVASHEILPEFREYERTATTVVDAYVTPIIREYLERLDREAAEREIPTPQIMQSNGGIAHVGHIKEEGAKTVLSGPAAGVVGASLFESESHEGIIAFDMGGTSTDVSLVRNGNVARTTDGTIGGHPVHLPMVDVETIGAGGGSIAWVDDGGALRVGPRSAGADPGPACYGFGGQEPTVTDAALVRGYLGSDTTLGDGMGLDEAAAVSALEELVAETALESVREAASGTVRIATERMARAVRAVTLERGHDPRRCGLVAFGGAGPMFATALAVRLDIETVHVPLANGVLSALGLLAAPERHDSSQTINRPLGEITARGIEREVAALEDRIRATMDDPARVTFSAGADLRYRGQSHELTVDIDEPFAVDQLQESFHERHERLRGFRLDDEPIQLVTVRLTGTVPGREPTLTHEGKELKADTTRHVSFDDGTQTTPVYDREEVPVGAAVEGPAIFEGDESTVVLPPGWHSRMDQRGTLTLKRQEATGSAGGERQ